MDNVTHTLFALTLARTPLSRAGRGTTAALVLASSAPDIDFVAALGGTAEYLKWHRGPTHGPLGILALGLIVAGFVHGAMRIVRYRNRKRRSTTPAPEIRNPAPFVRLAAIATLGVLCHVLMDFPTVYGTRFLSPWTWRWFAADWMPIVDIYLLAALAAGLLFGTGSPAARRRNVAIVLALMGANYGVRAVAHGRALANAPRLFGPLLPQSCDGAARASTLVDTWPRPTVMNPPDPAKRCLVHLVALPTFLSPFQWRVVAHLSNAYEIHDINLLDRRFWTPAVGTEVLWRTTVRVPNVWTPTVWAAAATPLARTFLGFARLPAVRSVVDASSGVTSVAWTDLRFTEPRPGRGPAPPGGPFDIVVRIAPDGRVLEERVRQ